MSQQQFQDRLQRLFRLAGDSDEGRYLLELMRRYRGLKPL